MRRLAGVRLAAAAGLVALAHLPARGQVPGLSLSLDPPRLEMKAAAGREETAVLRVRNEGSRDVRVRLKAEPFVIDVDGVVRSGEESAGPFDATRWLLLNPVETEIPVGESVAVRATIQVPEATRGTCWTLVYAETVPERPAGADRSLPEPVRVGVRLGSYLYVIVTDPGKPAVDASLNITSDEGAPAVLAELVHRSGGVLRLKVRWRIPDGGAVRAEDETDIVLLPGGRRRLHASANDLSRASRIELVVSGSGISLRRETAVPRAGHPP